MSFAHSFTKTALKMRATPKKHGGSDGKQSYELKRVGNKWTCSCPDFTYRRNHVGGGKCKHIEAHLQGKKPWEVSTKKPKPFKEQLPGGLSSGHQPSEFEAKQLAMGKKTESEHTSNKNLTTEIAMDHLMEDPKYYSKLKKMEKKSHFVRRFIRE